MEESDKPSSDNVFKQRARALSVSGPALRKKMNRLNSVDSFYKTCTCVVKNQINPSDAMYRVVNLELSATDLPNLKKVGKSDPYYKVFGYALHGPEILYTSEFVNNEEFIEWKPAFFGVPRHWNLKIFKVFIFDKSLTGKDVLIAGPVDIHNRGSNTCIPLDIESFNAVLHVNKFGRL